MKRQRNEKPMISEVEVIKKMKAVAKRMDEDPEFKVRVDKIIGIIIDKEYEYPND